MTTHTQFHLSAHLKLCFQDDHGWSQIHRRYLVWRTALAVSGAFCCSTACTARPNDASAHAVVTLSSMEHNQAEQLGSIDGSIVGESMPSSLDVMVHTSQRPVLLEHVQVDETNGGPFLVPVNSGQECAAKNISKEDRVSDSGEESALLFSTSMGGKPEDTITPCLLESSLDVLEKYLQLTLRPVHAIDSMLDSAARAFRHSSSGSVLFTSSPVAAAASKPLFQLFLAIISGYLAYDKSIDFLSISYGAKLYKQARIYPIALRDGSEPGFKSSFSYFGLLSDLCVIPPSGQSWTNGTFQVWYNEPVLANGYYVTTGLDPPSSDMADWIIESTSSNWSVSMRQLSSKMYRKQMPMKRGADFVFDESIEAPFGLMLAGSQLIFAFGFALCVIMGVMGREVVVPGLLATTFVLSASMRAVAGLGFLVASGNYLAYSIIWITTPQDLIVGIGIGFFERSCISVLLLYSLMYSLLFIVRERAILGSSWSKTLSLAFSSSSAIAFALALVAYGMRWFAVHRAWKLVVADKERYDSMWQSIIQAPNSLEWLNALQQEVCKLAEMCTPGDPIQLHGRSWDPFSNPPRWAPASRPQCAAPMMKLSRIVSGQYAVSRAGMPLLRLDQLHLQASCIHSILLDKVRSWAAGSDGCFPVQRMDELGHTTITVAKYDGSSRFKWGKVKRIDRMLEKSLRVYAKDTSHLVDICRQIIIFENPSDLIECLKIIRLDNEAHVLRVKNRLDPKYNARKSAGYRDVALNLTLMSEEVLARGLEAHVCEVQLMLLSMYQLKSDTGHKHYVAYRNLRGE